MRKNVNYKITEDLTITQKLVTAIIKGKATGVYEYYIGKNFIFGLLEPFGESELNALYLTGYFDAFLEKGA